MKLGTYGEVHVTGGETLWSIARELDDKPDSDGAGGGGRNPADRRLVELVNPAQPSLV